jgi:hypothetical protein
MDVRNVSVSITTHLPNRQSTARSVESVTGILSPNACDRRRHNDCMRRLVGNVIQV